MKKSIAITLPVRDLERSKAFFSALGFSFDPQFGSGHGCGMVVSDDIFVMLCAESFFGTLTRKPMADPRTSTIALLCLFCDSRAEVDAVASKALSLGATLPEDPQDHGFMYQHGFADLDGHMWALTHIEDAPARQPAEYAAVQI
ncbi:VOC family protein [Massilia sp. BSC265]|uniref:VOC family protein n=1 Tax=Massilia sp. BSC265 TaxID=1549812 RepID=UPI0004E96042|nr:VOC family protein [Massilia sp. BSC265]KFI06829.1 extradiol dioxygenase [Massilia sp. BSC265]